MQKRQCHRSLAAGNTSEIISPVPVVPFEETNKPINLKHCSSTKGKKSMLQQNNGQGASSPACGIGLSISASSFASFVVQHSH
jgi:hypothetical protein